MDYIPRLLTERVVTALSDTPVVVLQGVRQCGKSTLAREITCLLYTSDAADE